MVIFEKLIGMGFYYFLFFKIIQDHDVSKVFPKCMVYLEKK